jgi:hypothetical protein
MIFALRSAIWISLAHFGGKAELNLSSHGVKGYESGNRLPCGKVVRDTFISVFGVTFGQIHISSAVNQYLTQKIVKTYQCAFKGEYSIL